MTTFSESMKAHPFLRGLDAEELAILEGLSMAVEFTPGEMIFRAGDPVNRFYLLMEGSVALRDKGVTFQVLHGGDVVGCSAFFSPSTSHFDVQTLTATKAIFFYGTWVLERCEADSHFASEMTRRMAGVVMERVRAWLKSAPAVGRSVETARRKETPMKTPRDRKINGRNHRSLLWKTALTARATNPMAVAVARRGLECVKAQGDDQRAKGAASDEDDRKIAAEANGVVAYIVVTPPDAISVSVRDRWVTLKGVLDDWNEREAVERVIGHLEGVRGVTNSITVEPKAAPCLA